MSLTIDLNCDMGEGMKNEEKIIPFISSANISCGYHAGNIMEIWKTVELAVKNKVAIGAHLSFLDKKNFGRSEMELDPEDIYDIVTQQLLVLQEITNALDVKIRHVKPHGALYNMSAREPLLARTITQAVQDFSKELILYGLSGSHSITEAKALGLQTASEVFADRTYQDDGSLTPRSQPNAVISEVDKAVEQVLQMVKQKTVNTVSGKSIPIIAETICIHGDGKNAVSFARSIHEALQQNKLKISSP
jgi:UPF0271 protein